MSYASVTSAETPSDYALRIKSLRGVRELTQGQLAELIGVSYATVNRWENEQSRPNQLAWRRIVELESRNDQRVAEQPAAYDVSSPPPSMDFAAGPHAVAAVAEAHRLAYGHLFNPAFATETSSIHPLPHQRIAVYEHMLRQAPRRFLLADDAGAGKTIMTGLYVREMLSRRLIRRVLIAPPAGLVGNWEREMRTLFRLPFRIVGGLRRPIGQPLHGAGRRPRDRQRRHPGREAVVRLSRRPGHRTIRSGRSSTRRTSCRPIASPTFASARRTATGSRRPSPALGPMASAGRCTGRRSISCC